MIWVLSLVTFSDYTIGSVCIGLRILLENVGKVYGVVNVDSIRAGIYSVLQCMTMKLEDYFKKGWVEFGVTTRKEDEVR